MDSVTSEEGAYILLMFWWAWFLRKDVIHGNGTTSIGASAYAESLQVGGRGLGREVDLKGKAKMVDLQCTKVKSVDQASGTSKLMYWEPPPQGWVKINTDAGYNETTGEASAGVIIRNATGEVLLTAWQMVRNCSTAAEAEAEACLRGVQLGAEWVRQPTIVETDCINVVRALQAKTEERAAWDVILKEIQAACVLLPGCSFKYGRRVVNRAAHADGRVAQPGGKTKDAFLTGGARAPVRHQRA
jgi:hypothetical protein